MGEAAGRTAVVYDACADEFDEPLRVFVTGYSATGLPDRRRRRGISATRGWRITSRGSMAKRRAGSTTRGWSRSTHIRAEQAFRGQGSL